MYQGFDLIVVGLSHCRISLLMVYFALLIKEFLLSLKLLGDFFKIITNIG